MTTLHTDAGFQSVQPQRPVNPHAWTALRETYDALRGDGGKKGCPWTRDETFQVGRLYLQAWGVVPIPYRLQRAYYLPNAATILRLWGSLGAYFTALLASSTTEDQGP